MKSTATRIKVVKMKDHYKGRHFYKIYINDEFKTIAFGESRIQEKISRALCTP